MPHVSVIMPVYNGARYVGAAIDSLLAQTFADWELIVVDDGSTDTTPQILDQYTDRRMLKVRQENGGEAKARNAALGRATGQYIAFLDADDLYLPNALQDLSGFLDQHQEYDIVFSDGYTCDENGKTLTQLSEHRPDVVTGNILEPLVLTAGVITVPVCTMTRREIIQRFGVSFDTNLVIGPDWDFWTQLARHAQFGYLDKLTCMYRVHYTNITRTSGLQKRRNDLVLGRMKVLNSDWFEELSLSTRRRFFYNLVMELLADQPVRQKAIFEGPRFRSMPLRDQAELWRQVGADYLLRESEESFAIDCLREALRLWPGDWKSRGLLWMLRLGRWAALCCLRLWQVLRGWVSRLRSWGRRRPKPVPAGLGPVGD